MIYRINVAVKKQGADKQLVRALVTANNEAEALNRITAFFKPFEWIKTNTPKPANVDLVL